MADFVWDGGTCGVAFCKVAMGRELGQDQPSAVAIRHNRNDFAAFVTVLQNATRQNHFGKMQMSARQNWNDRGLNRLPGNQHFVVANKHINL